MSFTYHIFERRPWPKACIPVTDPTALAPSWIPMLDAASMTMRNIPPT